MKKPSRYKIVPTEKKSIIVTRTYKTGDPSAHHEGDKFITVEETFRWGYAVIEAYKKDIPKNEEIVVTFLKGKFSEKDLYKWCELLLSYRNEKSK